jgi:hypothetical protein
MLGDEQGFIVVLMGDPRPQRHLLTYLGRIQVRRITAEL